MKNKSIIHIYLVVILTFSSFSLSGMPNKGRDFDLQGFIDKEISSGKKTIIVPEGTYRVKPQNSEHLSFKNLKDITIVANNVEMICTETTRAITFEKCTNVTIRGLVIDYDPLCFSQGKITKLSADKSIIEFKLDDNYPDNLVERIEIFDAKTNLLKRSSHYGWTKFEKIAERSYRVTKGNKYKFKPTIDTEEVGDILVTNNDFTPHGNKLHAVFSDECVNLWLENITLYSGNCFGFFETNGTKNTYLKCVIDRRPPETDMYVRSKRIRSNDADAFHSKFATIGPQIIECSARFQGDDGVNICGKYYLSTGAVGNVIRLIVPQTCDLSIGTSLEILTMDGKRMPVAKILKIEDDGLISNKEIEAVLNLKQNENNKRRLSNPQNKILKLIVDKELTFGFGTVIADVNKMGNGFLVKNCNFSYNRSRGILIKASNGSVIGNTLQGNWMTSVLISPEAWWLESGCSDNIEVSNNIILDNKQDKAIQITGEGFDGETAPAGLHNNINITNNEFTNCFSPVIYVASTKNGNITGNKITKPAISIQNVQNSTNAMVINCENIKSDF
ncbi:MAG: right-handed parallel beta-helix repeat-containing protein [Paludibacter sp.]